MAGLLQSARWRHGMIAIAVMIASLLFCSCSDSNPAAPDTGLYHPVQEASQIAGQWDVENVFASGLPIAMRLVPGATAGQADSRISSYNADLAVSTSGEYTGVFSTFAHGMAVDTADQTNAAAGDQRTSGGFTLWGEGQIEIRLSSENGKALPSVKTFMGTASALGDTLLLEFSYAVPPQKAVFFLPDTMSFLARLVRH